LKPIPLFLLSLCLSFPAYAQTPGIAAAKLQILWSTPITSDPGPPTKPGQMGFAPTESGFLFDDVSSFPDGRIVVLGDRLGNNSDVPVLLIDAANHGPGAATSLNLKGAVASIFEPVRLYMDGADEAPEVLTVAATGTGSIWIGGITNQYMGIDSDSHGDTYLAKVDSSARPLWERAYKSGDDQLVLSMAAAADGDVAAAAMERGFGPDWMVLVSAGDAHAIWKRRLGNGKGIAIAPAGDDGFLVASLDSVGTGDNYQENVTVRTVSRQGRLGSATIIRQSMITHLGDYDGNLRMSAADGGAYIVSGWDAWDMDPSQLQPTEVTRVSEDGGLLWNKVLPESFVPEPGGGGTIFCEDPAIATLPNGNALVGCALNGQIHLHEFDRSSGVDAQTSVPTPACSQGFPVELFLVVRKDGAVFLAGSQIQGSVGPNCSWLGRLLGL